ncbi:hypothetical protein CVT25_003567 [Psilocybe cyanescens]|uniref:Lysine-specific metallo-endopeptidase domain-containing protein n=1 Tax=Psilocybe cyanescens TaxID=93625 RepID=A0A409WNY8_PSICY|nr:hypothetical protein CVT25_003567 [Psilocybe cyanescens]
MFYPSYATLAVATVLSLQSVLAAPMPMEAKIGDGDHKAKVVETMPVVNQKLKNMKAVINLPDAQAKAHPATVKAFGKNANVAEIRKNINTLDSSKIMIPHTDAEPILTQGGTYPNGHIKFGSAFYSSDKNTRAGTIIHEASHAKIGTVDHFKADGKPGGKGDPYVGCITTQMGTAYSATNAPTSPEEHWLSLIPLLYVMIYTVMSFIKRRELLRRAAKACAWKPKSKAAATKETAKKAAVKPKGSQKSVVAKKPLNAAKSASKSTKGARVPVDKKKTAVGAKVKAVSKSSKTHKPVSAKTASKPAANAKSVKAVKKPVQQSKTLRKSNTVNGHKAAPKPVQHSAKKLVVKASTAKSVKAVKKSVQQIKTPRKSNTVNGHKAAAKPVQHSKVAKPRIVKAAAKPVKAAAKPAAKKPVVASKVHKAAPAKAAAKPAAKAAPKGKKK